MLHTTKTKSTTCLTKCSDSGGIAATQSPTVLVFGGAGYIGSHCVLELTRHTTFKVVVVDNFSTGHEQALDVSKGIVVERADIRDAASMRGIFSRHSPIFACLHFCASIEVAESMRRPLAYYSNNVTGTLTLLEMMEEFNVKNLVFSSTAAVYGSPADSLPISEESPISPTNVYGETKRTVENALRWCEGAFGLRYVILRYFNACGADASGLLGEAHSHETHLIPLLLQVALGQRELLPIYGDDYATADGTCVRDYVHVSDLASAHVLALDYLGRGCASDVFNLGSGRGHSVMEVVDAARRVTQRRITIKVLPRRPGDSNSLVASSAKAEARLGWQRKYSSLDSIVESAWRFHLRHPHGYFGVSSSRDSLMSSHSITSTTLTKDNEPKATVNFTSPR